MQLQALLPSRLRSEGCQAGYAHRRPRPNNTKSNASRRMSPRPPGHKNQPPPLLYPPTTMHAVWVIASQIASSVIRLISVSEVFSLI